MHELAGLDAEFEERCRAQVFRLVAQDCGELGTLRYLQVDGRFDVLLLLFPVSLSLNFPSRAVVEIMLPILSLDILSTLCPLLRDQLSEFSNPVLVFRACNSVLNTFELYPLLSLVQGSLDREASPPRPHQGPYAYVRGGRA